MNKEVVVWGIQEHGRVRIGCSSAVRSPLPFAARAIARVPGCDADLMRRWCRRQAKRGWGVERMIRVCEVTA